MVNTSESKINVAVVGAGGYSGRDLARILMRHPRVTLAATYRTGAGVKLSDLLPEASARQVPEIPLEQMVSHAKSNDIRTIFLATPHAASLELAPLLIENNIHVIDLSGAFRLSEGSLEEITATYKEWYALEHKAPGLVPRAEYGLRPWASTLPREGARLIANPGCYATAILMGLLPLLKNGLIDPASLVIDAKSGTTGAGKKAEERLLHAEVDGLCLPYRVGRHQHEPELSQMTKAFTGVTIDPHFTPHLINTRRGLIAGLYARLAKPVSKAEALDALDAAYAKTYGADPLVEFAAIDRGGEKLLNLRRVAGSARTQIAYQVDGTKLYVFSLIDNLMKGAASQAVENLNVIFGWPTSLGLTEMEGAL